MKTDINRVKNLINQQKDFLRRTYNVESIGIFGSMASGQDKDTSDIDVLVEFAEPIGLFKFIKLEEYLSKILDKRVDIVTRRALKPAIRKDVLKEVIYV